MHIIVPKIHSATGFSPFFLLFGREPRLPIDTLLCDITDQRKEDFSSKWQTAMKEAYEIAYKNSEKHKLSDRARRNAGKKSAVLEPNDRVLLRNLTPRGGPGKLRNYWESKIYRVLSSVGDSGVVYKIQSEGKSGPVKTVHRNLLMPCYQLELELLQNSKQKIKGHQKAATEETENRAEEGVAADSSTDEEDEYYVNLNPDCESVEKQRESRIQKVIEVISPHPEEHVLPDEDTQSHSDQEETDASDDDDPAPRRTMRQTTQPQFFTYDRPGEPQISAIMATTQPQNPTQPVFQLWTVTPCVQTSPIYYYTLHPSHVVTAFPQKVQYYSY